MDSILFGKSELYYSVRRSPKALKMRIEITPYTIEVVAPEDTPGPDVLSFFSGKLKSVYIAQEKLRLKDRSILEEADQYHSGGKVSFRGRRLALRVERGQVDKPVLTYKSRFHIMVPMDSTTEGQVVEKLITDWLRKRLQEDSLELATELGAPLGLAFSGVRVKEQKNIWATCGIDGVLHINLHLIRLPRKVLEYVIAHELAHLTYRNHSDKFWALVEQMIPDYKNYQRVLDSL